MIVTAEATALAATMASSAARIAASIIAVMSYPPGLTVPLTLVPALCEVPPPISANTAVPTAGTLVGFWVHRGFRLVAGPVEETCLQVISIDEATPPVAVLIEGGRMRSPV